MVASSELHRLLSLVVFDARLNVVEGLTAFRRLLEKDPDPSVLRFLNREMRKLEGEKLGGVAFVVAEHYRRTGDLKNLQKLSASGDADVRQSVLNALCGEPGSNPQMGPGIVQLAIQGTVHPSAGVRTEACSVFQNQCAWGVDVSDAITPLQSLLDDESSRVRHQAAYAVGNLAKRKYDMSGCVSHLRKNLKHEVLWVRESAAWAIWQLSRSKHDIGSAVPELVGLLTDGEDYNGPRKKAAGALVHHAKKSGHNAEQIKTLVATVALDEQRKEIKRFLNELAKLK